MSLDFTKVTYVDGETVIGADNLNDIQDAILDLDENKVEKEQGKGLSANDFTDTDKQKVDDAYVVPEGGIPKSALSDAVQTALDKADSALQEDDLEDKASVPVTVGPTAVATFESSFADAPLKSLTVNIEPVQSGTGDPSPTNVRPISGWTGANLARAAKNLGNFADNKSISTSGFILDVDGRVATVDPVVINPGKTYKAVCNNASAKVILAVWNGDTLVRRTANLNVGTVLDTTGGTYFYVCCYMTGSVSVTVDEIEPMVVFADETDLTYAPHQGAVYPITFPTEAGTVYGGTLTINADGSGELVVDWVKILVSETWSTGWTYSGNVATPYFEHATNVNIEKCELSLCNKYKNGIPSNNSMADMSFGVISSGKFIRFRNSNYTNVTDFVASLSDVEVVIPLAQDSPSIRTHHLTTTEITTLLGTNNIWADCGNVTVTYSEYLKDIKDYVDQVDSDILSAVAPLEESYTASRNYAVGSYLFVGAKFYKVTSAIQTGGTINPGTNVTQTTVAEQLMTLAVKPAILG